MKKRINTLHWLVYLVILILLIVAGCSKPSSESRVLPSPYYAPTIVRAPIAWKRSTGAGITVAVTRNHNEDLSLLSLIAPDAKTEPLQVDRNMRVGSVSLVDRLKQSAIHLVAILEPNDFDAQILRETVAGLTRAGVAVFVDGDLTDNPEELALIYDLETLGTITVGRLDMNGKARGSDLTQQHINLFAPYGSSFDRGAVLAAAGVGALALAATPSLTPATLKQQLIDTADEMYQVSSLSTGQWNPQAFKVDSRTGDYSPTDLAFRFRRVNAARALGIKLDERWPVNALNAPAAWKTATGRGVTVAVIDQGFHIDNPVFQGHLVDKAAFFPGQAFSGHQNFHGTSMAKIVLAVAPDASLVFLHTGESNQYDAMATAYARAIDYAIAHKARVISSSAGTWPNTPEVHAAIDRAVQAGITFVWFHYDGPNDAVIRPGHFWSPRWEVGAFDRFFDDDKPSDLEGGLSATAPQIAAIAALILQNEPNLTPAEVKRRILETATVLPNGTSLADAAAAVENHPSGRKVASLGMTPATKGHCSLVYQAPGGTEKTAVEIEEQGQSWGVPIFPHRDILLYPWKYTNSDSSHEGFAVEANRDGHRWFAADLFGTQLAPGDMPASVEVFPKGTQEAYSVRLDCSKETPIHVEVDGDQVQLSWQSDLGAVMERMTPTGETSPSGYRLFRLELMTQLLPGFTLPIY